MPQFLLYARYANEQKAFKLDIRTVNEYIGQVFGKKKEPLEMAEDDPNNFVWQIKEARDTLIEQTGKKEFTLQEIWAEIYRKKEKK